MVVPFLLNGLSVGIVAVVMDSGSYVCMDVVTCGFEAHFFNSDSQIGIISLP